MKIWQARKILGTKDPNELKKLGYRICSRCSGSGNHSYNPMDGTTCFKCNGLGYVKIKPKK